jgi:hypothetical protein
MAVLTVLLFVFALLQRVSPFARLTTLNSPES